MGAESLSKIAVAAVYRSMAPVVPKQQPQAGRVNRHRKREPRAVGPFVWQQSERTEQLGNYGRVAKRQHLRRRHLRQNFVLERRKIGNIVNAQRLMLIEQLTCRVKLYKIAAQGPPHERLPVKAVVERKRAGNDAAGKCDRAESTGFCVLASAVSARSCARTCLEETSPRMDYRQNSGRKIGRGEVAIPSSVDIDALHPRVNSAQHRVAGEFVPAHFFSAIHLLSC